MMFEGANPLSQKCQNTNAPTSFIWCQADCAEMPILRRTKGEGHLTNTEVLLMNRPSRSITGGHHTIAEMLSRIRPATFYMVPHKVRRNANLLAHQREGSSKYRRNANLATPLPTNHMGPSSRRSNASGYTPHRIWAITVPQKCQAIAAQITPTRGHPLYAEMPTPLHLWSLKQGERNGQKIRR